MTQKFKNYINITVSDAKFNLCDMITLLTGEYCPLKPGTYHATLNYTVAYAMWPVSKNKVHIIIIILTDRASIMPKLLLIMRIVMKYIVEW